MSNKVVQNAVLVKKPNGKLAIRVSKNFYVELDSPDAYTFSQRRSANKTASKQAATSQVSAWQANTATKPTDMVRLSTGEILVAVQAAAGNTGANEPAVVIGAAPAAIVDGAVTWWPISQISKSAPSGVPIVSVTDNAGVSALSLYNFSGSSNLFEQVTAPNNYTVAGAGTTLRSTAWTFIDGSAVDIGFGGANGRTGSIRTNAFITQSDVIDVGYFATVDTFVQERARIEVDGFPVSEVPLVPGAIGGSRHWKLKIPGGCRRRLIRIHTPCVFGIQYVGVRADCTIEKPTDRSLTAIFAWDSFNDTELPPLRSSHYDLVHRVSRSVGFPNCVSISAGGTSYTYDDPINGRKALQTIMNLNDLSSFKPDMFCFGHGYNAAGNAVLPATEANGAQACWSKARDLSSFMPIPIIGPWYSRAAVAAQTVAIRDALKAKFLLWADPRSAFIDPLDGSVTRGDGTILKAADGAWINATNAAWALPPNGGVFDGNHPSIAGAAILEDYASRSVDIFLASIGL